jgi:phosphoribosylglycinamide formyltransferase-1
MTDVVADATSVEARRARVTAICRALPEAGVASGTGQHSAFEVRGKKFVYFLVDHHGDGRVALNCKVESGSQGAVIASDPARFFMPAYVGAKGWIGFDFDAPLEWAEVEALLRGSYRLIAPKKLAAMV